MSMTKEQAAEEISQLFASGGHPLTVAESLELIDLLTPIIDRMMPKHMYVYGVAVRPAGVGDEIVVNPDDSRAQIGRSVVVYARARQ